MIRAIVKIDGYTGAATFYFFQHQANPKIEDFLQVGCINNGSPLNVDFAGQVEAKLNKLSSNSNKTIYRCGNTDIIIVWDLDISRENLAREINGFYREPDYPEERLIISINYDQHRVKMVDGE